MNSNVIDSNVISIFGLLSLHRAIPIIAGTTVKTALQNLTEETLGLVLFPYKFLNDGSNT